MFRIFILLALCNINVSGAQEQLPGSGKTGISERMRYGTESAKVNPSSAEIVSDKRLPGGSGISLKKGVTAAVDVERAAPDLTFELKIPAAGRYEMRTFAVTDEEGAAVMKKAKTKYESLFMKIRIDEGRPTKRVMYVPWDRPLQVTGKFSLTAGTPVLKIWLPRGVRLEYIELNPYVPPKVPAAAQAYRPEIVPPSGRPRLWVNQQTLPKVKAGLSAVENRQAWEKVKKIALNGYPHHFDKDVEIAHDDKLEQAAEAKAFYYLMTGDKKIGREAIELMSGYLSGVEFGNILDITREIGRAIFTASEVYDWCYDLLTPAEKKIFCDNLMRLSDDMEIGWPPFLQKIVNGHGNEAQVCRDLLAMSIAIYDEDPLPYQYTSYAVLKELVPMRKFEYQSPRHNQGVNYGAYRFGWDMHAAWLFYGMTGKSVFDENIKKVHEFWLYMRSPDGQMLRDGDGFGTAPAGKSYYWSSPLTMLLCYAYAADPILKADFERQGGLPNNPVLFLLLNDPKLKAEPDRTSLPLTKDFGPVLSSMIARTGWDISRSSNDVVAEIKGGGYHFGNHQHSDAGAVQLYYKGFQFGDIGLYKFYGTPYDLNFNKRSVAHSMMLAVDPSEKYLKTASNDGGSRLVQTSPKTPAEAKKDPTFNNGKVLASSFGPSRLKPWFSYFSADLSAAYTSKLNAYTRSFCFLNMDRKDIPAVIILADEMVTASPEFKKYWQINSLNLPELTGNGVILQNELDGQTGKTHVNMLLPAVNARKIEVLSGADANSSGGIKYEVPVTSIAEANGHRVVVSPNTAQAKDHFLTVFQVTAGDTPAMPVAHYQTTVSDVVVVGDRVVSLQKENKIIGERFVLNVPVAGKYQVLLTGMKAGDWNVKSSDGKTMFNVNVKAAAQTIFFKGGKGSYTITPGLAPRLKMLVADEKDMPGKR